MEECNELNLNQHTVSIKIKQKIHGCFSLSRSVCAMSQNVLNRAWSRDSRSHCITDQSLSDHPLSVCYLIHIRDERTIQAYICKLQEGTFGTGTTVRNFHQNSPKRRPNVSADMTRVRWREARQQPRLVAKLRLHCKSFQGKGQFVRIRRPRPNYIHPLSTVKVVTTNSISSPE